MRWGGRGGRGAGVGLGWGEAKGKRRRGVAGEPTYLVEELGQLYLHLLALEHVVLCLLADGRDQVELPGHGVGLLGMQTGPRRVPVYQQGWGLPEKQGRETQKPPQETAGPPALPPPSSLGRFMAFLGNC